jgi:hypothetical protein
VGYLNPKPFKPFDHDLFSPLQRIILWVLVFFAVSFFFLVLPTLYQRLTCPIQLQQADAINVERAMILIRGENLYPDPTKGGPYLYTAYPPLFFWLEAQLIMNLHSLWLPGRLLAFTGYIGCGLLLGFWAFARWGKIWALLLPALLWTFPSWQRWGTVDRPDTLFIFLQFTAFLLLYRQVIDGASGGRDGMKLTLLAGLLEACAVLIKQSSISLLLANGVYCLFSKRWKNLFMFYAACLIPVGMVVVWESVVTGGLFSRHTFVWLNTGFKWDLLWYWLSNDLIVEAGWLLALLLIVLFSMGVPALLGWQMLFGTLNLISLGRLTGAENYWLEFILMALFCVGECAGREKHSPRLPSQFGKWARWAMVIGIAFILCSSIKGNKPEVPSASEVEAKMDAAKIYDMPGEHLALDTDLPLMAGKRIWIQPHEYSAMVKQGFWSVDPLIRDIRTKKYSTIEIYDLPVQYLLPQPIVDEIGKNYHVVLRRFGRLWLSPNKAQ